jgi:hypothetical protein
MSFQKNKKIREYVQLQALLQTGDKSEQQLPPQQQQSNPMQEQVQFNSMQQQVQFNPSSSRREGEVSFQ